MHEAGLSSTLLGAEDVSTRGACDWELHQLFGVQRTLSPLVHVVGISSTLRVAEDSFTRGALHNPAGCKGRFHVVRISSTAQRTLLQVVHVVRISCVGCRGRFHRWCLWLGVH